DVKALAAQTDIEVFREGFYFDDLDESRADVPEIKVIFGAFAGAAISIGFADAGIDGGVDLDISFNAHDPNKDGKVRFEEYQLLKSPACLFDVSAGLSFYLTFRLHVDLLFFTVDKVWDIYRSPRISLFEFACDDQPIVLATKDETAKTLTLTIGNPTARQGFLSAVSENYAVKQLGSAAAGRQRFSVTAFNLTQVYDVPAGTTIVADAGAGNDQVRLLPGVEVRTAADGAKTVETIDFDAPSRLVGGAGNDRLVGGAGVDDLDGGGDTDALEGGAAGDVLEGGPGTDTLDAGAGGDTLDGGAGTDSVNGGAGPDIVRGGTGDDQLDGGTGAGRDALFPTSDAGVIAGLLDSGDAVVGDGGNDVITGGDGSDIVVGGGLDTSAFVRTAVENVTMLGMQQSGALVNVPVALATLALPTLEQVRTTCADAGTATTPAERDKVTGGPQGDQVLGGGGADDLSGGAGADVVCGRGGDDLLFGDGGDVAAEDEGADEVRGGPGADRMFLGGGADQAFGDAGIDLARGGTGDDVLTGGEGADLLLGEAGADRIAGDDPTTTGGTAGSGRSIVCGTQTGIVNGKVDLDGDLVGSTTDTGQLEGMAVDAGIVEDSAGNAFSGVLGSTVFSGGRADLDGNGTADSAADTGVVDLAGATGNVGNGDCILGGDGTDPSLTGGDGGDSIDGGDGDEPSIRGEGGDDLVRGGTGEDTVLGDAGNDLAIGDSGDDALEGGDGDDVLRGGADRDLLIGGSQTDGATDGADELIADRGDDVLTGDNARMTRVAASDTGTAIPGVSVTLLGATPRAGGTLDDTLFGGFDDDWAFGQAGADTVRGGHDDDVVEGGPGADTVHGDDDADLVVGGSSTGGAVTPGRSGAALPDGGDRLFGDAGADRQDDADVIAGDNARLDAGDVPSMPSGADIKLFDVVAIGQTAPAGSGGADTIEAGGGDDAVFGQVGDDEVRGGMGHDVIEGDAGSDRLFGGPDDDAIAGGSSVPTDGVVVNTRIITKAQNQADGDDLVDGGTGDDVIAGDNARLLDRGPGTRADGTRQRLIRLFDAEVTTSTPTAAGRGADTLLGAAGKDIIFGQGGPDWISGGDGDDIAEGNANGDTIAGNGGEDDLTGGGSATDGIVITSEVDRLLGAPSSLVDASASTLLDGADAIYGADAPSVPATPALDPTSIGTATDSHDVVVGDNGRITRTAAAGGWRTLSGAAFSTRTVRTVAMADAAPGATASSDALFGQLGDDDVYGGFDSATTPAPVLVG
ncbi:MAG TPA: calcium-binding protein, partial [Aquihabitans sp.]|nr:calcium-binding protein [Aquihabitans sp.]